MAVNARGMICFQEAGCAHLTVHRLSCKILNIVPSALVAAVCGCKQAACLVVVVVVKGVVVVVVVGW